MTETQTQGMIGMLDQEALRRAQEQTKRTPKRCYGVARESCSASSTPSTHTPRGEWRFPESAGLPKALPGADRAKASHPESPDVSTASQAH